MRSLFYHPVFDIARGGVEVDAHLCNRQATECKTLVILSEIDLVHRRLWALVQLQLHQIKVGLGLQHHIHPALWRMHLHIHNEGGKKGKDNIERIVFVDEHRHLLAALLVSGIDEVYQAIVGAFDRFCNAPFLFYLKLQSLHSKIR